LIKLIPHGIHHSKCSSFSEANVFWICVTQRLTSCVTTDACSEKLLLAKLSLYFAVTHCLPDKAATDEFVTVFSFKVDFSAEQQLTEV
jgi:hypothetical protein